jgi:hypothetical protein
MSNRWEVAITDLDSVHTVEEIELSIVYTLKLNASSPAEAERTALDRWHKEYPSSAEHETKVKSSQIYAR